MGGKSEEVAIITQTHYNASMLHIALFQPEIPPNTGNVIRLCANTGAQLHLIHPLGFTWDDKRLRRAGMDYAEFAEVQHHQSWEEFKTAMGERRIIAFTTKAQGYHSDFVYQDEDALLFGQESAGLPQHVHEAVDARVILPMHPDSRSLNLSNTVAIGLYEAWRQLGY
jgi:tRNA (cytidine/uridine-2'-O-)-methyltransferase